MARKIYYRIRDDGNNFVSSEEWDAVKSLQNWYNSEFFWTGGEINIRRFLVFPDFDTPEFTNRVNDLLPIERARVLEDWNWLGYESKADFDFNGDDFFGFDLNRKICHLYFK
jgi:hypothetical protein